MSKQALHITIAGEQCWLHPLKAMFWPRHHMLIICDVHVGKIGHFRANGIALPALGAKNNYWNLAILMDEFCPHHVVVIGDLTHSQANSEWDEFKDFLDQYPQLRKTVVAGNHDAVETSSFKNLGFEIVSKLIEPPFIMIHEPPIDGSIVLDHYTLSGHLHPGVRMVGKAKTSITLPCFYFGEKIGILPAFGAFTGYTPVKPMKSDVIYAILEDRVIDITANKLAP